MLKNNWSGNAINASRRSFSNIHLRMLLSPEPASPVNNGEPLVITAILDLPLSFILEIMCWINNNWPSLFLGNPAPNLPSNPFSASASTTSLSCSQSRPYGGLEIM